jgi:hypothetical protein
MSDPVVNIRCSVRGCRRLLLSVSEWPATDSPRWSHPSDGVWAEGCPKHRELRPKEVIADADERRAGKGLPPLGRRALMVHTSWAELRAHYLDAISRGRAVDILRP